jgi:hypothetical protein
MLEQKGQWMYTASPRRTSCLPLPAITLDGARIIMVHHHRFSVLEEQTAVVDEMLHAAATGFALLSCTLLLYLAISLLRESVSSARSKPPRQHDAVLVAALVLLLELSLRMLNSPLSIVLSTSFTAAFIAAYYYVSESLSRQLVICLVLVSTPLATSWLSSSMLVINVEIFYISWNRRYMSFKLSIIMASTCIISLVMLIFK